MISTGICRWLFLLISLSTWTKLIDSKEMRIVCYYTNWSVYRPGQAKFSPQNINPYLCTHLIYAFGGFTKENKLKPFDKYQDIEKGGYAKFVGLKTYNKNLKTMMAIGGWNEGSSRFSPMVASPDRRKELVKNAIKFLRQNHFDGLDLDWEYPTFRDGGKDRDRDNYAQLVKELREEFERESEKTGRPRLLLTMAVPAGIEYINQGYDVPKLTKYLDWMNILSYDYHSAFEPAVNHHAPLYSLEEDNEYNYDGELNIDYTIKHYLKLGADPSKLVLGIPTYGRSYTLFNPDAYEIGAPADGPGDMGDATRENGYLAYYEICEYIKEQDWEVEEPNPKAMGPIAYKDNQWVGYDDENIVRRKAEYVAENSLGGIMFWAIDNDDFRGNCHGKPYPLIEAGKEALINAYGLTEENLISPPSKPTKSSKQKSRNRTRKTTTTEKPEEIVRSTSSSSRRRRIKTQSRDEDRSLSSSTKKRRKDTIKKAESSTYSSLKVITPAYTTPAPPATPDTGGVFKCEEEGFFPHPKDCKKYFWCLSGAGDSGLVSHQFTCPAGLYFNKAADSCDYSQNVLCDKKLEKAPKPTTEKLDSSIESVSSESPTPSSIFSTSRVPPKITAATSKNSLRQTTTTEAYDDEYEEYEDEEDEIKPEEDPKVLKELINLIKKAGGIEQLEKQINFGNDNGSPTSTSDSTTPFAISKSLVERVLSKTSHSTLKELKKTSRNRNSGGPQGLGSGQEKKINKIDRGKLQYKTITRQRSSTERSAEEDDTLEEPVEEEQVKTKQSFRNKSSLEYVNIRRPKSGSTTEANDDDGSSRNKILGETDDEEQDDESESEDVTKRNNIPKYVNIRRQTPSTTETSASSSKYASVRRSTSSPAESNDRESSETNEKTKYKFIRRGSTTSTTESGTIPENQTSRYQTIRRGSTTSSTISEDDKEPTRYQTIRRGSTTSTTISEDDKEPTRYQTIRRGSTTSTTISEDDKEPTRYQTIRRGSTTSTTISEDDKEPTRTTSTITGTGFSDDLASSKYNSINRSTTTANETQDNNDTTSKYQTIRRGSTTSTAISEDDKEPTRRTSTVTISTGFSDDLESSKYNSINRSTTTANETQDNNDTTSKYQTIKRGSNTLSGITTSEEPTLTTTSEKEDINSVTENYLPVTTLKQETTSSISLLATENIVSSTHETTTESNIDVTTNTLATSSIASTETSEIVTEKKRPALFQPRPFSVGTGSTVKPTTTESTTVTSKVSQSNLRFRLRQTSSPITTEASTTSIRTRGRSRLSNINRNLSEDTNQEEKYERIEENKPIRTRKRLPVVTQKSVDNNEDSNRKYRPAELADLSSLTAADLKHRGSGFVSGNRRRRLSTPSPLLSNTTTEKVLDEYEKTGSRTLPLVRKLIDPSTFGKSRRVITKNEDQINAGSDQASTTRKVLRGFRSTTQTTILEELPIKINETAQEDSIKFRPRQRKVFRRVRPTSSTTVATEKTSLDEVSLSSTTARTSTLVRKRIPLFRSRQTKTEGTFTNTTNNITLGTTQLNTSSENPLIKLLDTKSRFEIVKNETVEEDEEDFSNEHNDVLNGEEGENIKLSESNIRESSQLNTFGFEEKSGRTFSKFNLAKSAVFNKPSIQKQEKESVFGVSLEKNTETEENVETTTQAYIEVSRTEPTRIIRTRKIIRKISTTEPTTAINSSQGRRKTFRPQQSSNINELEIKTKDSNIKLTNKKYNIINRSTTIEPKIISEVAVKGVKSRRIFRPSYENKNREESQLKEQVNNSTESTNELLRLTTFADDYSMSTTIYDLYTRPTLSPTKYDEGVQESDNDTFIDTASNDNDDNEDDYEKDLHEETDQELIDVRPKYSIYTTSSVKRTHKYESNTNFEDEDEEGMNDGLKANKSISSFILTTAINSRNESETIINKEDGLNFEDIDNKSGTVETSEGSNSRKELSQKRYNVLRSQQERPSFTRQRLPLGKEKVQTKLQKGSLKTNLGFSTTTVKTTITPFSLDEELETTETLITETPQLDTNTNIVDTTVHQYTAKSNDDFSITNLQTTETISTSTDEILLTTKELGENTLKYDADKANSVEIAETTINLNLESVTPSTDEPTRTTSLPEILKVATTQVTEASTEKNLGETTTEYQKLNTLSSVKERPRLGYSRKKSEFSSVSTTSPSVEVSSKKTYRRTNTFSKSRVKAASELSSKLAILDSNYASTPQPVNRFLHKYGTTVKELKQTSDNSTFSDKSVDSTTETNNLSQNKFNENLNKSTVTTENETNRFELYAIADRENIDIEREKLSEDQKYTGREEEENITESEDVRDNAEVEHENRNNKELKKTSNNSSFSRSFTSLKTGYNPTDSRTSGKDISQHKFSINLNKSTLTTNDKTNRFKLYNIAKNQNEDFKEEKQSEDLEGSEKDENRNEFEDVKDTGREEHENKNIQELKEAKNSSSLLRPFTTPKTGISQPNGKNLSKSILSTENGTNRSEIYNIADEEEKADKKERHFNEERQFGDDQETNTEKEEDVREFTETNNRSFSRFITSSKTDNKPINTRTSINNFGQNRFSKNSNTSVLTVEGEINSSKIDNIADSDKKFDGTKQSENDDEIDREEENRNVEEIKKNSNRSSFSKFSTRAKIANKPVNNKISKQNLNQKKISENVSKSTLTTEIGINEFEHKTADEMGDDFEEEKQSEDNIFTGKKEKQDKNVHELKEETGNQSIYNRTSTKNLSPNKFSKYLNRSTVRTENGKNKFESYNITEENEKDLEEEKQSKDYTDVDKREEENGNIWELKDTNNSSLFASVATGLPDNKPLDTSVSTKNLRKNEFNESLNKSALTLENGIYRFESYNITEDEKRNIEDRKIEENRNVNETNNSTFSTVFPSSKTNNKSDSRILTTKFGQTLSSKNENKSTLKAEDGVNSFEYNIADKKENDFEEEEQPENITDGHIIKEEDRKELKKINSSLSIFSKTSNTANTPVDSRTSTKNLSRYKFGKNFNKSLLTTEKEINTFEYNLNNEKKNDLKQEEQLENVKDSGINEEDKNVKGLKGISRSKSIFSTTSKTGNNPDDSRTLTKNLSRYKFGKNFNKSTLTAEIGVNNSEVYDIANEDKQDFREEIQSKDNKDFDTEDEKNRNIEEISSSSSFSGTTSKSGDKVTGSRTFTKNLSQPKLSKNLNKFTLKTESRFESDNVANQENEYLENEEQSENDKATGEEEDEDGNNKEITSTSSFSRYSSTSKIKPTDTRILTKNPNQPKFSKNSNKITVITETETRTDLGPNIEAVKNRNKNLFSKRKMNIPIGTFSSSSTENVPLDTTESITESITTPSNIETDSTDPNLTTLVHVFADTDSTSPESSTESMDSSVTTTNSGKVERLIEVNRIVEIKTKQAKVKNHSGSLEVATNVATVDKIGEISRITLIKIVDGNNKTIVEYPESNDISITVESSSPFSVYSNKEPRGHLEIAKIEEIPASKVLQNVNLKNIQFNIKLDGGGLAQREDRKYEIFGESKVSDNKISTNNGGKPEIIDGISHINIVTPKPVTAETSTISLQGLFQTDKQHLNPSFTTNDEVLETGRSEFVNVRVLDQDSNVRVDKGLRGDTSYIPISVLPQDSEEVTMKAHVVEIRPKSDLRTIKIVPIRVEMSRSLAQTRIPPNTSGVKT